VQTQVIGINNRGDTGGFYIDQAGATHGFLELNGTFTTVNRPGTTFNQVLGLNNRGQAAGFFQDAQQQNHAWIRKPSGAFRVLPIPNSQATDINDQGVVVGFTQPTTTTSNAFILRGDKLTILSYPGSTFTQALGENNAGQVVGTYNDANGTAHGFVYDHGTFRSVDVPGATATTINGINNAGRIVGFFTDVADNTVGFVGTPTTAQAVTLFAPLKGANEVPGPGSPTGGGTALLTLDPSENQVCYSLAVAGLAGTVSLAHIHQGAAGLTGPVVVQFQPPTQGSVSGCVTIAPDLLVNLVRNPGSFYVNVHTTPNYPAGAARGQLQLSK
jgi:probable HAF family extracellular repeat protein